MKLVFAVLMVGVAVPPQPALMSSALEGAAGAVGGEAAVTPVLYHPFRQHPVLHQLHLLEFLS